MIYSPSQTTTWDRCRWKWYLSYHKKIRDKYIGKRELAACVGSAFGGVLAVHYKPDGQPIPLDKQPELATVMYNKNLDDYLNEGRELCGTPEEVKYPEFLEPMLKTYHKTPAITENDKVHGTEYKCGEDNNSYIDAWGENDRGLWVLDWKAKMNAKPYQITQELNKYQHSWQLGHYVWSVKRFTGDWPKTAGISLNVCAPTNSHRFMPFEVDMEFMVWWYKSAQRLWDEIEAAREWLANHPDHSLDEAKAYFSMSTNHMDGIFKCEYTDPCMLYHGEVDGIGGYITIGQ